MIKINLEEYKKSSKEYVVGGFRVNKKTYDKLKIISNKVELPVSTVARTIIESTIDDVKFL